MGDKVLTPQESRDHLFRYMREDLQDYQTRLYQLASVVGPQDEDGQFVIKLGIERVELELAWTQHIRNYFNKRDKSTLTNSEESK